MRTMISSLGFEPGDHDAPAPKAPWSPVTLEAEILAVLDAQPAPGERVQEAFCRKEAELAAVFSRLGVIESRELHRRLTLLLPGDPVGERLTRLVPEHRARLIRFLADARRREAIRKARGADMWRQCSVTLAVMISWSGAASARMPAQPAASAPLPPRPARVPG